MIISASRRTDIPAFYSEWFMNRIRAGYCTVPNPFNRMQVTHISLAPEDVDVIVFWTRNPAPLLPHLKELDERGFRYYFQHTLMGNPRVLDPHTPRLESAIATFRSLADAIGPERVIWRYDPIVFSTVTTPEFHRATYRRIAEALRGYTFRSVISIVDLYRKTARHLHSLESEGVYLTPCSGEPLAQVMSSIADCAHENGMQIVSCAEEIDLGTYGIEPGKCVDDEYIKRVFGIQVSDKKDPSQREACGCVVSKDIGMYDTCLFGCRYCYATSSLEQAQANYSKHDPNSPSLLGWYEAKGKPEPSHEEKR